LRGGSQELPATLGPDACHVASWAITMGLVFVSLVIVRHHIPKSSALRAADVAAARTDLLPKADPRNVIALEP